MSIRHLPGRDTASAPWRHHRTVLVPHCQPGGEGTPCPPANLTDPPETGGTSRRSRTTIRTFKTIRR